MKITVTSTNVNSKPWNKGDRSGVIRTQDATAENARFRQSIRLDLGKDEPFAVGVYDCDLEQCIVVNQYGDLQLARKLVLVQSKAARAA